MWSYILIKAWLSFIYRNIVKIKLFLFVHSLPRGKWTTTIPFGTSGRKRAKGVPLESLRRHRFECGGGRACLLKWDIRPPKVGRSDCRGQTDGLFRFKGDGWQIVRLKLGLYGWFGERVTFGLYGLKSDYIEGLVERERWFVGILFAFSFVRANGRGVWVWGGWLTGGLFLAVYVPPDSQRLQMYNFK